MTDTVKRPDIVRTGGKSVSRANKPKRHKPVNDGSALRRRWTPEELKEVWDFAQHDFDRFLRLLVWIDKLVPKP